MRSVERQRSALGGRRSPPSRRSARAGAYRVASRLALALMAVGLAVSVGPSSASPSPGAERRAGGRPIDPSAERYVFVPGDVLEITVTSHPHLDRTVTIQPDGRIQFPRAGEVVAAGSTAAELARRIEEGLKVDLVDPRVTVSLKELNRGLLRRVSVLGAVKNPGVYELKEQSTVAEILATAGGPTPVADLRRVTITSVDGARKTVADLSRATRTGEVSDRVSLEPGDLVIVPEGAPPTALVLGEVVKPGSYELQGEMRLLDALSLAGGPTARADLRRVTLTRAGGGTKEIVDLQELLTKGQQKDLAANLLLQPGDTLVLPENERKFYVLGEVTKADAFPLKPADRVLDGLTTAGGSTRDADLTKVMLIRKDEKGQPLARRVNLKKMMMDGRMEANELLREGDVLFVPSKNPKRPITDYLTFLYPLTSLLTVLRF
jgi:polysaccharide biosynthesis/export protein